MRNLGTLPSGWLGGVVSDDADDLRPFLVPGVRVRFDPIGRRAVRAARAACAAVLREAPGDYQTASDALTSEMIRYGIVEWEGVGDRDGVVAPVTPEMIDLFIADTDLCEAAEAVYVQPWLTRDMEKNGFAGSSPGISQEATPGKDTASKSASGIETADASPIRKPKKKTPASAARTSPTSRGAKPAKASSKS